ncbi:MAG: chorismate-binding protein [Bacteroidia bacterium]
MLHFRKKQQLCDACSSPERFLYRNKDILISQPIKGTNKRMEGINNTIQMDLLKSNEKERAENVMIVDLVRNDISKVCKTGECKS